jgi:hypothetical protein
VSDLNNVRRGELKRLLRHRGVSEIEVYNAVEDIMAERVKWTAAALGQRVNLTFEEKTRLVGIKTIACVDRTKKMMRLYYQERKRERDRMRVNKMREKIPRSRDMKGVSPRAKQLAGVLNGEWIESRALGDSIRKRWKLKPDAIGKAVRRAGQELSDANIAELKYGAGSRGSRVLFLRLKKPMNIDVSERREVSYIDKISTLRRGDSKMSGGLCPGDKNESLLRRSSTKPGTSENGSLH